MKRYFQGLSRDTFLLAFASLFSDISTEMLYPVLPTFLIQTLGAKPSILGLVEGVAVAAQNVVQGISGWLSDRFQRRKPIALTGYIVGAVSKPLIGMSSSWVGVLGGRSLDRLSAGARSAPRDALVAASVSSQHRGRAFGLEGIGDNLGAFLGPLVAIALLGWFGVDLRSIFLLAIIPGLCAAGMISLVHDRPVAAPSRAAVDIDVRRFPAAYWRYLGVTAIFGVGNSSNSFLILRTQSLGASLTTTVLIYACFNLFAALASYPAGYLADHLGRKQVLLLAFGVFLIVYLGFGTLSSLPFIAMLFVLYGVFQGIYRAVGKTLATDFVGHELRASSIGWYSATVGLSGLVASVVGGELWTRVAPASTFLFGAAMSGLGIVAAMWMVAGGRKNA